MRNVTLLAALPCLVLACESYSPDGASKPTGRIAVTASALDLSSIGEVCYDLEVHDGEGALVWTQRSVCSSSYGDGRGGITYVGSCDASAPDHTVSLTLTEMTDGSGAPVTGFTNPCPPGRACTRVARCVENADTPVDFDLTVMRGGGQGFFDVAVSIDDIACSAKLDCDTTLLADPETGERAPTAILALACSSRTASAMRMSDITLECDSPNGRVSIVVDPSQGPGNYFHHGDPHVDTRLTQVASWRTNGAQSSSWAVGIAPDLEVLERMGVSSCTVHARATASKDAGADWSPPEGYPYIEWSSWIVSPRDVASGLPTGKRLALSCPRDPASGQASGVSMQTSSGDKRLTKAGHVTLMK